VESEPEPNQLWMNAAGPEAKTYKVEPEIWVPVTQSKFVGQAS